MAEIPPMPKGFIDPHAPDAAKRLEAALNARVTAREPRAFVEFNPGGNSWTRERFEGGRR